MLLHVSVRKFLSGVGSFSADRTTAGSRPSWLSKYYVPDLREKKMCNSVHLYQLINR